MVYLYRKHFTHVNWTYVLHAGGFVYLYTCVSVTWFSEDVNSEITYPKTKDLSIVFFKAVSWNSMQPSHLKRVFLKRLNECSSTWIRSEYQYFCARIPISWVIKSSLSLGIFRFWNDNFRIWSFTDIHWYYFVASSSQTQGEMINIINNVNNSFCAVREIKWVACDSTAPKCIILN